MEAADEGLRLMNVFISIRDPSLRAVVFDFAAMLAKQEERDSLVDSTALAAKG